MTEPGDLLAMTAEEREQQISTLFTDRFGDLMELSPAAFEAKFRKMASSPFAFYRGSAHLFYRDLAGAADPWAEGDLARTWIHGDLHAENYGTYMSALGRLHFDVNDFDESCLGAFTWDLRRMAASVDLLGFQKAIADDDIERMVRAFSRSYLDQVAKFATDKGAHDFALTRDSARGHIAAVLRQARERTRVGLLEQLTVVESGERRFAMAPGVFRVNSDVQSDVAGAFEDYLDSIPPGRRPDGGAARIKDVVGRRGVGIGSAGLPSYNLLLEGHTEAMENDVVLFMKQARPAAPAEGGLTHLPGEPHRFSDDAQRTVSAQRGLQADTDPWLGHCQLRGRPMLVAEVSPYAADICWDDLNESAEILDTLEQLGRATAKIHCVSDRYSDNSLVPFCVDEMIHDRVAGHEVAFEDDLVEFSRSYASVARRDHSLFLDAYRNRRISTRGAGR